MPRKQNWYSIQAKQQGENTVAEIRIYDEIGFWGITAKDFAEQLDAVAADASELIVSVNSPGGNVFDAFAIYNAIRRYAGKVTCRVDGVALSAASMIICAGDTVVMPENAMLMIHNAWLIAGGTAEELRKYAEMMDKATDGIVAAYTGKSGKSGEEIRQMMDETTWLTAFEAHAMGFCDVIEEPVKMAASARTTEVMARLPGVPEDLMASLSDETPADGESTTADPNPAEPVDGEAAGDGHGDPNQAANGEDAPADDPAAQVESATPAELVAHAFDRCQEEGIPHLARQVMVTATFSDKSAIDARISQAKEIVSLCAAARKPDMAESMIAAGMNTEQARARLFDAVTDDTVINPRAEQTAQPKTPGLNASEIYSKRKFRFQ